jgi:FdhE protein
LAGDFLRKLFGRSADLPDEVKQAQAELARLAKAQPGVAELAGQLHDFLPALYTESVETFAPNFPQENAAEKLASGVPLLGGETLKLPWPDLKQRLLNMVGALEQRRPDAATALKRALRSDELDVADLTRAVVAGQPQYLHERAESLGLDPALTASLLSLGLFPFFVEIRAAVQPMLGSGAWQQGYCPVCGSFPRLGEFRGLEQIRFLRCGLCAAEWQFPRLRCPGCGNHDHRRLGYLHVDGEEGKYRAATCDECRQYVKMVSTLTPMAPLKILVTDVGTLHLDLLAAERGYSPLM